MATSLPQGMENSERAAAGTGRGSAAPRPTSPPKKQEPEWEERKSPEFVEFKGEGESVEGRLISVKTEQIEDKDTHQKKNISKYLVRNGADAYEFIGTWDICKKLTAVDVNKTVRVTFKGENREVKKGNNFLKEFEVLIAKSSQDDDGRPEISDADIPF